MNAATPTPAPEERTTLFQRRHVRRQFGKTLGHFGPALVLVWGIAPVVIGAERLTLLTGLEAAVGVVYLVLMVREMLHLRHHPFQVERVAWLELAAAAILALEGYHIWHRHHAAELAGAPHRFHVLPWIYAATACMFVVLAFRAQQLTGRLFLHLHPEGFAVRTGHFGRAHHLRWADIAAVEPAGATDVVVRRTNGQEHRIAFDALHDGTAHRDRLLAHAQKSLKQAE
ncbi:hypothetical protein Q3A66_16770 [Hymenobacter sp. BT770]|uniref:hypothetical protein n=1 Tax=Hymenobacter sp. BT770 TaxID=2886942 RepID=UPI001D129E1D|nr:hypothetical protein [Hymenobacter sp. BT770]MCC3154670.1 hypothetical protein [Hymenobacter sp. BT770]MDO3416724.1 hypothetical protein [Hymenobacter sp. BT770]